MMIEEVLRDCQSLENLIDTEKNPVQGVLSYYELTIAEAIRDDELAKEAAYEEWETAQTEHENRETACRDRAGSVVSILFNGFNKKSFQTIEAIFPAQEKLAEKFWKGKWSEQERAILDEAAKAAAKNFNHDGVVKRSEITRQDLKQAAERAGEIERRTAEAKSALAEVTTELEEFDEDEMAVIADLAEAGFGTKEYKAKIWQGAFWSNRKKAKQIEARLQEKTVADLLAWWNAANAEKSRLEIEVEELGAAAVQWQKMASFGQKLQTISAKLVPEIEATLTDALTLLNDLPDEFRKSCAGDELLRSELMRLIHQNRWAAEGRQEMETRAQKLRAQQDRVFTLHEALNSVRREQTVRRTANVAVSV